MPSSAGIQAVARYTAGIALLLAGLWLSLLGVTGAALVFFEPLLKVQLGERTFAASLAADRAPAVDEWIANAREAFADGSALGFVSGAGFGFVGSANLIADVGDKHLVVTVDADSGKPLGRIGRRTSRRTVRRPTIRPNT